MSDFREQVPLVDSRGMVNPEWFRNFTALADTVDTGSLTPAQEAALAQLTAFVADLSAFKAQLAALTVRVTAAEAAIQDGFQS